MAFDLFQQPNGTRKLLDLYPSMILSQMNNRLERADASRHQYDLKVRLGVFLAAQLISNLINISQNQ